MKKFTLNLFMIALTLFCIGKVNAQGVVDLTGVDNANVLVDTLPDLSDGAIVLLKPGMTYNAGGVAFDKSVTLQSSEPGNLNRPKIDCQANFNFADGATVDSIILRNLEFMGGYNDRYILNSNVGATVGKFMLDGCYIHDLRGVLRMKDAGPGSLDQYVINNCFLNMIRDYGVLTVDRNDWVCDNILIQNSTVSKARTFLTSRNNTTSLVIDGCTLSEVPAAGQRMFRWRESDQDSIFDGIMVKNTIWGTGWDEEETGSTAYDGYDGLTGTEWTFENTWAVKDLEFAEGKDTIKGFNFTTDSASTGLWADVAEGNLNYADTAFDGIGNAGDQRWGVATDDGGVEWNISTAAYKNLGEVDATRTVAGLTIFAHSGKTVTIDENNKSLDGMDFTNRLKLGGSGDFDDDGQPLGRVLSIDVTHTSMITVMAMSSSSSADRRLDIVAGHEDNLVDTFPALGASLTKGEYDYYGGPTKLYFYSPSSGVNVYYIKLADIPNKDASLASLSVTEGNLDPAFDPDSLDYKVLVASGTTTVTVSATPADKNAEVTSGTGEVDVSSGHETVNVVVTAEDGSTIQTYTLDIIVATGIEDTHMETMFVYPTVSRGVFNVEFTGTPGVISVYDLTGKRVLRRNAVMSTETIHLDNAGVYLFRLESENQSRMVRVISIK